MTYNRSRQQSQLT